MTRVRRSLLVTFLASNLKTLGLFALTLALARLISPEQIGIFSIAVVVINLVAVLRDFGTGPYLVQKSNLSSKQVGAVLGLTLTLSWALAMLLAVAAPKVADVYAQPEVIPTIGVLTLSFLLVPYVNALHSLFMRHLSAERSAAVSLVGAVVYGATCLTLAVNDFGALALAWGNFAHLLSNLAGYWLLRPKQYVMRPLWCGWREPLSYGRAMLLGQFSQVAYHSVPDLALGKVDSALAVGLFSRASGLVGIFHQAVAPAMQFTALPYFAQQREQNAPMKEAYLQSLGMFTMLSWPFFAWVASFSNELIHTLYGSSWTSAAPLVPWLALAAGSRCVNEILQPALQAMGKPHQASQAVALGLFVRMLAILGWGTDGLHSFVVALCAGDVLSSCAHALLACRHLKVPPTRLIATHAPPLTAVALTIACSELAKHLFGSVAAPWVGGMLAVVALLLLARCLRHAVWAEALKAWKNFAARLGTRRTTDS